MAALSSTLVRHIPNRRFQHFAQQIDRSSQVAPYIQLICTARCQRLSYNDTAEPGLYAVRFDPTTVPQPVYYGVGIDRRELDPAALTDADYAWLKNRGYVERAKA